MDVLQMAKDCVKIIEDEDESSAAAPIVREYVLMGDDAFKLSNRLMKPNSQQMRSQRLYNYKISRCHRIALLIAQKRR